MEVMSRERQNILFSSGDKEYISFTWNLFHSKTVRIGHLPTIEKTHLWTIGAIDFDVSISYIRKNRQSFWSTRLLMIQTFVFVRPEFIFCCTLALL